MSAPAFQRSSDYDGDAAGYAPPRLWDHPSPVLSFLLPDPCGAQRHGRQVHVELEQ